MPEYALTKHYCLTEQEMSEDKMNPRILRFIEYYHEKMNLEKSEMNLLD